MRMRRGLLALVMICGMAAVASAAQNWAVTLPGDCTGRGSPVPACVAAGSTSNYDLVNTRMNFGHFFEILVSFSPTSCSGGPTPGKACAVNGDCGTGGTCPAGSYGTSTGAGTPQNGDFISTAQFRKIGLSTIVDAICESSNNGREPLLLFKSCTGSVTAGVNGTPCVTDAECATSGTCSVASTAPGIRLYESGGSKVANTGALTAILDSFTCLIIGR